MKKNKSSKSTRTSHSAPMRGGRRTSSALNKSTRTANLSSPQMKTSTKGEQEISRE